MRRWIRLAAALYPSDWRERYGVEFQALLEDVDLGWPEFADVMWGALKMQMSTTTSYLKIAGATAVAGAIVAAAASFGVPRQYVSEAVVSMTGRAAHDAVSDSSNLVPDNAAAYQFGQITSEILSRFSLVEIIVDPSLDLYRDERMRLPLEDVVLQMRRDIRISPSSVPPPGCGVILEPPAGIAPFRPSDSHSFFASCTFFSARISFAYRDKQKAQEVVRRLVTRLTELNTAVNINRARIWQQAWQSDPAPTGEDLLLLDPASPPKPVSPNRPAFMAGGLGAGLLLGLSAASAIRRPKWTLQMAGFASAGCALAVAGSFLLPDRYTSTAVMRFSPLLAPPRLAGELAGMPTAKKLQQLEHEILSRNSLSQIIQKPSLNLYPEQRTHATLEDIIAGMGSRDIIIQQVRPSLGSAVTFSISFSYPDRFKATAVVRELVARFEIQHVLAMRSRAMELTQGDDVRSALEHKLGENLEVLDPPNVPESPNGPNRLTLSAAGLAIGLSAGGLTLRLWRHRSLKLRTA